jgi:hypothetical protein
LNINFGRYKITISTNDERLTPNGTEGLYGSLESS